MNAVIVMVMFMVAGLIGSVRNADGKIESTGKSTLEKAFALAEDRGTDSDWTEFCYLAMEPGTKLTSKMKTYMADCHKEMNP